MFFWSEKILVYFDLKLDGDEFVGWKLVISICIKILI